MGILEHTDVDSYPAGSPDSLHLQIEAIKLAFAGIERFGDPRHIQIKSAELLDSSYLRGQAGLIDRNHAALAKAGSPRGGKPCAFPQPTPAA